MSLGQPVCIVGYARTPIGKFNGALSGVRPDAFRPSQGLAVVREA